MMIKLYIFAFFLYSAIILLGQNYQGPAAGSVPNGVVTTTESFLRTTPISAPQEKHIRNEFEDEDEFIMVDFDKPVPPEGSNYYEDPSLTSALTADTNATVLLRTFAGISETNSIPPDPHIAVGPTHIIATVNSRFAIWDKEGNLIKNIDADQWYTPVLSSPGAFDPKVLYDHIDKRWIMVWLNQNSSTQTSNFLISVSDDSIPTGTWYNWALPSHMNGSTIVTNWGDYQGVGFDKDAIYICTNQFDFNTSEFQYVKIRVLPKAQLYANTAGSAEWKDIWDIRYPHNTGTPFNIRPSITYGEPNKYYLLHSPSNGGNFMSVYTISDPLGTPTLSGFNIPVTFFQGAPNANQLGGSSTLIEGGGSAIRNEPTYRDGYLWAVHSVRNPNSNPNSSVRYVKLSMMDSTAVEDVAFGAPGFWHIYPAIAVDKDQNVAISYSRSGDDEYIGAFYTTRLADDPPGLSGSVALQTGNGNYVKTFSGTRNRWGDYNGIWLDPAEQNNFWMFTEYVSAINTWGTWIGEIRLVPYSGTYVQTLTQTLNFGNVEVNDTSEVVSASIQNLGEDDLIISNIPQSQGPFELITELIYPITLSSYESLDLEFQFTPTDSGNYNIVYPITSNDNEFLGFNVSGIGYQIGLASYDVLYAASGPNGNGNISTLNIATAAGNIIGESLFSEITRMAIHPKTNVIYAVKSDVNKSDIIRINANGGDGYVLHTLPVGNISAIAFDTTGALYAALKTGEFYLINLDTGSATEVFESNAAISGIAFNPINNELLASALVIVGANKDRIFKIDPQSGDTTIIGKTGFSTVTNDIAFDGNGILYGIKGNLNQISDLFTIDKTTGAGTLIGSTGLQNLTSLGYVPSSVATAVEDNFSLLPNEFALKQNYPNPFNPATTIEFALPSSANVRLTIYNLLGEVVAVLLDNSRQAGYHKVVWNSNNGFGTRVTSGIYFYEIKATADDGKEFSQMRKMILLK